MGDDDHDQAIGRRGFLVGTTSAAMAAGLVASYGTFAAIAARYLYPPRPTRTGWIFVTDVAGMPVGESRSFRTPSGAMAAIARRTATGAVDDFFYEHLIPEARAITKHAAETGKAEQARAVDAVIDGILARPEHAWKAAASSAP